MPPLKRTGPCAHCHRVRYCVGRGLCCTCHDDPAIRQQYQRLPRGSIVRDPCRHCQRFQVTRPRGLCWTCYFNPDIRNLYPSTSQYATRDDGRPRLPVLRVYPDSAAPEPCPCGADIEGACPSCERAERTSICRDREGAVDPIVQLVEGLPGR